MSKRSTIGIIFAAYSSAVLAGLLFLASNPALAGTGGWNGGGDQFPFAHDAAWFLTKTSSPVRYCVKFRSLETFGVSPSAVRAIAERSFGRWVKYLADKRVQTGLVGGADFARKLVPTDSGTAAADSCTGTEDLRIELDTTSSAIETEMKKYRDPIAFSAKGELKPNPELSGAWFTNSILWVSDLKARSTDRRAEVLEKKLEIIFTHEFGHVFGNAHVEGTIMDERAAETALFAEKNQDYQSAGPAEKVSLLSALMAIDQRKVLLLSPSENYFSVSLSGGMVESNEISGERRNPPAVAAALNQAIPRELFGLPLALGDHFPPINGQARLGRDSALGYVLEVKLSGHEAHALALGKPVNIVKEPNGGAQIFQRIQSIQDKELQSFSHETITLEFRKRIAGGEVPVLVHLNQVSSFLLEVGDPALTSRSWYLLLADYPTLTP